MSYHWQLHLVCCTTHDELLPERVETNQWQLSPGAACREGGVLRTLSRMISLPSPPPMLG